MCTHGWVGCGGLHATTLLNCIVQFIQTASTYLCIVSPSPFCTTFIGELCWLGMSTLSTYADSVSPLLDGHWPETRFFWTFSNLWFWRLWVRAKKQKGCNWQLSMHQDFESALTRTQSDHWVAGFLDDQHPEWPKVPGSQAGPASGWTQQVWDWFRT